MSQTLVLLLALSLEALTVAWAGPFKGGGEHCDCLSLADLWICTKEQSCGQFDPPCIHSQIIAGDGHPNLPYASDYGASCKAHKEPGLSRCYDPLTGLELPGYEQADFCKEAWCYVDPCTCNSTKVEIKKSEVLSTDGKPVVVAISYANCGASNSRPTKEVDLEGNMTAWTSQYGQCPGLAPNDGRQCAPTSAPTPAASATTAPTAAPMAPTPASPANLRGKSGRPVFSCLGLVVAMSAALGAQH